MVMNSFKNRIFTYPMTRLWELSTFLFGLVGRGGGRGGNFLKFFLVYSPCVH